MWLKVFSYFVHGLWPIIAHGLWPVHALLPLSCATVFGRHSPYHRFVPRSLAGARLYHLVSCHGLWPVLALPSLLPRSLVGTRRIFVWCNGLWPVGTRCLANATGLAKQAGDRMQASQAICLSNRFNNLDSDVNFIQF